MQLPPFKQLTLAQYDMAGATVVVATVLTPSGMQPGSAVGAGVVVGPRVAAAV